jgi:zinc transport system ATP-binding protein
MISNQKALISCQNLSYFQGSNIILQDISFDLLPGNIITIIGPNGGGKTTLLKVLLGILSPSKGKIYKKKGIRIGYMPQRIVFNHQLPMTVRNFLFLNYNVDYTNIDILQIISETSLTRILDQQVHNISGGELQRLMLAKALLHNPDLMLLDEPLQGLDIKGQNDFYVLLDKIRLEQKIGMIMVSHDLHTVIRSTNHVICLNKHICCQGLPETIQNKSYENLFGLPVDTLLAYYTHRHDEVDK